MVSQRVALSLEDIIQFELPPLFRHQHLNRDLIVGWVGPRGGGKSISGGLELVMDYGLQGEPTWSNAKVKATFDVDDRTAAGYGLRGGQAVFEAGPLDKYKLLKFSPEYRGGAFFTHEINIWLADARRSMSNLNLEAVDIGQELRKLESAWIYDCIHEMFVDVRLRDFTDIFVQTRDTALTAEGMARKQPQGHEFEWYIYPMTGKLNGVTYAETGRPIGPIYVKGKQLWGLVDTMKRERREKYPEAAPGGEPPGFELGEPPDITERYSKWGFLAEAILRLHNAGYTEIHSQELWEYVGLRDRGLSSAEAGKQLAALGVRYGRAAPKEMGGFYYAIDQFDLKEGNLPKAK
jgi:hypothetical protein